MTLTNMPSEGHERYLLPCEFYFFIFLREKLSWTKVLLVTKIRSD